MNSFSLRLQKIFWNKRIPVIHLVLSAVVLVAVIFWQYKSYHKAMRLLAMQTHSCPPPEVIRYRMHDYRFAKPLILLEVIPESNENDTLLNTIRNGINQIIDERKSSGDIHTASIYLRELNSGGFISINNNEYYHPASLIKIPKLIAILRQSEITPGLLDKKVAYSAELPATGVERRYQTFMPGKTIQVGHQYSVKELLYYMIVESDNQANRLLNPILDEKLFEKLFTDLGMPSLYSGLNSSRDFTISAPEFSKFMRVLYNASYISHENADYALSLLTHSTFKEGILKAIPPDITVAHKFGEFGRIIIGESTKDFELHESAIIYFNNDPLLFTIMTKGKDQKTLAEIIAEITKYIYEKEKEAAPASLSAINNIP